MDFIEGPSQADIDAYDYLARTLKLCLGGELLSIFGYGAAFFARPRPWKTDLDLHVVCQGPLSATQVESIRLIDSALDGVVEVDAWFIEFREAIGGGFPRHLLRSEARDTSWALHRAHVYAGRYACVIGQDPRCFTMEPTWEECLEGLRHELAYIESHLDSSAYSTLNLMRILCSLELGSVVVSKYESAKWGLGNLDDRFQPLIRSALDYYCEGHSPDDFHSLPRLLDNVKTKLKVGR